MNKQNFKFIFLALLATAAVLYSSSPAQAEEATTSTKDAISIQLRIEGPTNTLLNTTISVPETCAVIDAATTTPHNFSGYKAICALQTAQENGLLTYQVTDWGWGFSLDKINETTNATDWSQMWIIRINNAAASTGIDGLVLNSNDNLLITYGSWPMEPLQIISSTSTLEVNTQLDLQTKVWNDTTNNFVDFTATSTFWIDDKSYESNSGALSWTAEVEGSKQIRVEAEGKTRSDYQTIIVLPTQQTATSTEPLAQTNRAIINYLNEEIFNGDVSATSTWFYDSSGALFSTSTVSALGVLAEASRQGNFPLTIQGGWGYYVSEINGHAAQGFDGWIYNINQQDPGWVGMNDYQIQNNDLLTVFYSVWPWKIESSTGTVHLGENVVFTAFNYASSTWQTGASTTISINSQLFVTNDKGGYIYTPSATGTLSAFIYGSESWPQNSPTINVTVIEPMSTSTTTSTPETDTGANNTGGGGGNGSSTPTPTVSSATITEKVQSILKFLKTQQSADGKIIDGGISDWAIMSFGAADQYAQDIAVTSTSLLDFAKNYNFTDASDLNVCASYPRHILALLAGGIPASDMSVQNLIVKIKSEECYKNNKFGLNGINDDVFALFALLADETPVSESIISDILTTIIADQTPDGAFTWAGWASADITGAAINALQYAKNKNATIDQNIFTKAKSYLKSQQLSDGGWGFGASDVLTTGWAMMGINSLNEGQTDWSNSQNKNPWSVLVEQLKYDGYYEPSWAPGTVDWFATKHATPALLGKSWPIILAPKPQPVTAPASSSGGGGVGGTVYLPPIVETATSTASSTLPVAATSTPAMATSTLPIIPEITPTPASSTKAAGENILPPATNFGIIKTLKLATTPQEETTPTEITEMPATSNISATPPVPPTPIAPLEKKVATTTAASSAILFAGTTLLLFGRLLLTIL